MNLITRIESQRKGDFGVSWLEAPTADAFNAQVQEMNNKGYKILQVIYANDGYTIIWELM